MSVLVFPDNTVLINFALIQRMDLLREMTSGRAAWCITVASECEKSSHLPGLEALGEASGIFGSPWFPDASELVDIQVLRLQLAVPGDERTKHLGEAETIVVASRRTASAIFVTDDRSAQRAATAAGLEVCTTGDMLRLAVRVGLINQQTAEGYVRALLAEGRAVSL